MENKASDPDAALIAPPPQPRLDRRRSFRDISKMDPEIVKSVIAKSNMPSASSNITFKSATPRSPDPNLQTHPTSLRRGDSMENDLVTTPVTIFYNGTVSVFDLPKEKAQNIIKLAMESERSGYKNDGQLHHQSAEKIFQELHDGEMPIKRKKSLQRFFEKRKERLIAASP